VTQPIAAPIRILLVDDEQAALALIRVVLTRASYQVSSCSDPDEALRHLRDGDFGCVITDAVMPGKTGFDFVKEIRKSKDLEHLPVIMLTRKRNREDFKQALEAGVTDYLLKPIDENLLLEKVASCLNKKAPIKKNFEASLEIEAKIVALRETGLTLLSPFAADVGLTLRVRNKVFDELSLGSVETRIAACARSDNKYRLDVDFVDLSPEEIEKLRVWLGDSGVTS